MNLFLLTGLFLNTAQANPDAQNPESASKPKAKHEIRVGGTQLRLSHPSDSIPVPLAHLEYGTRKITLGVSSSFSNNNIYAQYNLLSTKNDRIRAIMGIRGTSYEVGETLASSAYLGSELHFDYVTVRGTGGMEIDEHTNLSPILSMEILLHIPSPFTKVSLHTEQNQERIGNTQSKHEIRLGASYGNNYFGLFGIPLLNLEYGGPTLTVGLSSLLFINNAYAHYNLLSTKDDRLRAIAGLRATTILNVMDGEPFLSSAPYLGTELHFKHITLRTTGGIEIYENGETSPTFHVDLLYNFRLK